MYGYPPPYYPWAGPYPTPQMNGPTEDQYKKGMLFAMKLAQREEREKERKENRKKKDMDESRKRSRAAFGQFFTFIELYIIGVLTAPLAGELYHRLVH